MSREKHPAVAVEAFLPPSPKPAAEVQGRLPPPVLSTQAVRQAWPEEIDDVLVPGPLPAAVAKGVFGIEDNGEPVEPSREEVRSSTVYYAERLTVLLESPIIWTSA